MIRIISAFVILLITALQTKAQSNIFEDFIQKDYDAKDPDEVTCSKLEGTTTGPISCYPCDHEAITSPRPNKGPMTTLTLRFSNCTTSTVCCLRLTDLDARSSGSCGINNPQGNPPSRRRSLRAVLEREYPWRAWVYRDNQVLCAATFIESKNILLTTATCVNGYHHSELYIKFSKTEQTQHRISAVKVHEKYRTSETKVGNANDIAILVLENEAEPRVQPVCMEKVPVRSSCVLVSDNETYLNTVIPPPETCTKDNVNRANGANCAYVLPGEYTPQRGAGLYCLHMDGDIQIYSLHGIYQADQSVGSRLVFTDVKEYSGWIDENIKKY